MGAPRSVETASRKLCFAAELDPSTRTTRVRPMASVVKRPEGKWRTRYRNETGKEHASHFARKIDATR